jgi:hypothetical protein
MSKAPVKSAACPHDCPSVCALEVEVLNSGRIGRIRGAKDHPYTLGVICEKVARYAERLHHAGRLLHPLKRKGDKGGGEWQVLSWDDALDEVAAAFIDAEKRFGPEAVWAEEAVSENAKIIPTGLGKWLLAPDAADGKIRVEQPFLLKAVAAFDVGPGVSALYSAWFDTIAIASAPRKAVIYDLDAMVKVREIPLEGATGPGSVTPDGKKLFLPLAEAGKIAVIDAQARRLTNMIPVGPEPVAAVMAGGYGVCH